MSSTAARRAKAMAARAARVREYWFPWPGDHQTSDHLGISVHTLDGEHWALRVQYLFGGTFVWTGEQWQRAADVDQATAYQWSLDRAENLAPVLARGEAARFAPPVETGPDAAADQAGGVVHDLAGAGQVAS